MSGQARSVRVLWRGDRVEWRGFSFEVLHPAPGARGAGNDRSLVLAAEAGGRSLLLTGDLPEDVETILVRRRVLYPVNVAQGRAPRQPQLDFFAVPVFDRAAVGPDLRRAGTTRTVIRRTSCSIASRGAAPRCCAPIATGGYGCAGTPVDRCGSR